MLYSTDTHHEMQVNLGICVFDQREFSVNTVTKIYVYTVPLYMLHKILNSVADYETKSFDKPQKTELAAIVNCMKRKRLQPL
jgi:hypothetical protein